MSSIKKSDVASKLNSGSAIVQRTGGGKQASRSGGIRTDLASDERPVGSIEPQSALDDGSEFVEESLPGEISGSQGSDEESEQLRGRDVASAITRLNDFVQNEKRDIEFAINEEAGISVVKVVSRETGELIRRIPGKEVVDLARKLNDQEPLRLFSAQV
jgi:uncharacterized FlaG/YvyC family protein